MASDSKFLSGATAFVARCSAACFFAIAAMPGFAMPTAPAVVQVPSVTRIAGTAAPGYNTDFGTATSVNLNAPTYSVFDSFGNQYISDTANNCVRKIDPSGNISTVAGLVQSGLGNTCNATLNSTPTAAQGLIAPAGLAVDSSGSLYIADSGHNCIRKLPAGAAGTLSLIPVVDSCQNSALLSIVPSPRGIALDTANNIYVATANTTLPLYQVVKATSSTTACYVAGTPSATVATPCPGLVPTAILSNPNGLAFDPLGNLFIADTGNSCVREVNLASGTYSTPVGQCANDGSGNSNFAINSPFGIDFDPQGRLLIVSNAASQVYQVTLGAAPVSIAGLPSGATAPYSSSSDGSAAVDVGLSSPKGISVDSVGNIYVSDTGNAIIRELSFGNQFPDTPVGSTSSAANLFFEINAPVNLSTQTGTDFSLLHGCSGAYTVDVTTPDTCLDTVTFTPARPGIRKSPLTLTDSTSGKTYTFRLVGKGTGSAVLFSPGTLNTLAFNLVNPVAVTVDTAGDGYYVQAGTGPGQGALYKAIAGPNGLGTPQLLLGPGAGLNVPSAITWDADGNVYIADTGLNAILKYDVNGTLSTAVSGLTSPTSLAIDIYGNLYVTEGGAAHDLLEIQPGGEKHVIAGGGGVSAANGIPATSASFVAPTSVVVNSDGTVYVADSGAHLVFSIDTARLIHLAAGNGTQTDSAPGTALGTGFMGNIDLGVDAAGDLYISDSGANRILVVYAGPASNGATAILAGTGAAGFTGDGGPANLGEIKNPTSLTLDGSGNVYFIDAGNSAVRLVSYPQPVLNFGSVLEGQTSPAKTTTLWNVGTDNLNQVPPQVFTGAGAANFSIDNATTTCGLSILPGAICNLGYVFAPTAPGTFTSTVDFNSNSYFYTNTILLSGSSPALPVPTLTVAPTTIVYGQPAIIHATVTGTGPAPTGTVTFTFNGAALCAPQSVPPSGQVACLLANPQYPPVGTYSGLVTYSGDSNYGTASVTGTLTVTPAPLTVTASSASRAYGTPNPALTATIVGLVAGNTATATATTTATVSSPVGTYPIVPAITPTGSTSLSNYTVTVVNGTLTVTQALTTTTLTTSAPSVYLGTPVTFTAQVKSAVGLVPPGTVTFTDGTQVLGTVALSPTGTATFTTSALAVGTHSIVASYSATLNFTASSSAPVSETVLPAIVGSIGLSVTPGQQLIRGAGQSVYQVTVLSLGGFIGPYTLSCAGLPKDASCAFATSSGTLTAGGSAQTTMTTTTTTADARLELLLPVQPGNRGNLSLIVASAVFPLELTSLAALFSFRRRKSGSESKPGGKHRTLWLVAACVALLGLAGCGCPSTAFNSYPITVTATSVNGGPAPTTVTVYLSVAK
ncbi:MAG: Ig-like domain repeat protein [Acidobacteriaceae bacterium]